MTPRRTAVSSPWWAESGSGKSTLREELIDRVKNENGKTVIIEPYTLAMAENESNGKPMRSQHIAEAIISTIAPGTSVPSSPEMRFRRLHQLLKSAPRCRDTSLRHHRRGSRPAPAYPEKPQSGSGELKDGLHRLLSIILIGQTELLGKS